MDGPVWHEADPDRLLTGREVAEVLGIKPGTWRWLVHQGSAPVADEPDAGTVAQRRTPRWRASTVAAYQVARRRPGRPRKDGGNDGNE